MGQESETIEFKETLAEKDEAGEVLVSFANKSGGKLYFGVKNNGTIIGLPNNITEKITRDLSQLYVDNTEPKILPTIKIEDIENHKVISIEVSKSEKPYHTYKKRPYIRIGSETKNMPQEEYQSRLVYYKNINQDFSSNIVENVSMDDMSPEALLELRKLLKNSGRFKVTIDSLTDIELLKNLQLFRDNKFTVASLVLLAKPESLTKFMPYVEVRYSYKLTDSESRTQDIEIFNGGYLLYYNKIWDKINSRNITLTVPQGLLIREVRTFDEESMREAINNTIIHRDYSISGSIFITQYQNKIEVKSPGGFVFGVTIENILDESKTRNKLIADTLFKCEFVEHLGNGVNLMFKKQLSRGKNPPNYNKTTMDNVFLELDGKIKDIDFAKYVFNIADKQNKELNDKELLVLNQIKDGKRFKTSQIAENLLSLGLIEKISYGKYILSRTYYDNLGRVGEYTRIRGLSKEENKMLILKHLEKTKGFKKDLAAVLPNLTWPQIYRLLIQLKNDNKIEFVGDKRSHSGEKAGFWKLIQNM